MKDKIIIEVESRGFGWEASTTLGGETFKALNLNYKDAIHRLIREIPTEKL